MARWMAVLAACVSLCAARASADEVRRRDEPSEEARSLSRGAAPAAQTGPRTGCPEPKPVAPEQQPEASPRDYVAYLPGLSSYEENYFAWRFAHRFQNGAPHRDGSGYTRAKFQISVRYEMFNHLGWRSIRCNTWPSGANVPKECAEYAKAWSLSLAFAYTQKSFWDLFSSARSAPFVESNYRPEAILAYRPHDAIRSQEIFGGFMHESNGLGFTPQDRKDFPPEGVETLKLRSRSWNNFFLGTKWSHDLERISIHYGGRVWVPLQDDDAKVMRRNLGVDEWFGAEAWVSLKYAAFYDYITGDRRGEVANLGRMELNARVRARSGLFSVQFADPFGWTRSWFRPSLYVQAFLGRGESLATAERTSFAGYVGLGLL